jgi:hypothetical protein
MRFALSLLFAVLLCACSASQPTISQSGGVVERGVKAHDPVVLEQVAEAVRMHDKASGTPVVVFDLDDTLFSSASRTIVIVHEFAREPQIRAEFPQAAAKMESALVSDMKYGPEPTFRKLGIDDSKALDRFKPYWAERFFSNAYCVSDDEIPGGAAYVRRLRRLGAHIVYFTGRDVPRMKTGTLASLKKRGFPRGERTTLILKPNAAKDDLEFKREASERIARIGPVVGVFENEPRNLNLFGEVFPKAILVFVDSLHSAAPDVVTEEAHWVKNFVPSPKGNSDG